MSLDLPPEKDPKTGLWKKPKPIEKQREDLPKAIITPKRLFTPEYVKEMKILINEVLDERQYQKELSQAVDNPTPPGISYFYVEQFKHSIDDPEPEYPLRES